MRKLSIHGREPLLRYLARELMAHLEAGPKAELPGDEMLRLPPDSLGDVRALEPHLLAPGIDTAEHDVDVRVVGVVMVHSPPDEPPTCVALHLGHQLARERGQVQL